MIPRLTLEITYLVNGAEATVAEFVELGEETGGDLQSLELEKEIKGFENVVVFIPGGCSGTSTGFQSVEEGTKAGAKPHHQRIKAVASLGSLGQLATVCC